MKLYQHIKNIGSLNELLKGLGNEYPISTIELEDQEWVIVVDTTGNAKRIATKTKRMLLFSIDLVEQ